jgi:hypothetical protein
MRKGLLNIICGACIGWTIGALGTSIYFIADRGIRESKVECILDTNRDRKLSPEEIKRFYDETETTPYTKQTLFNNSSEDLNKFLDKYKEK